MGNTNNTAQRSQSSNQSSQMQPSQMESSQMQSSQMESSQMESSDSNQQRHLQQIALTMPVDPTVDPATQQHKPTPAPLRTNVQRASFQYRPGL